jgi:hypothetical protein
MDRRKPVNAAGKGTLLDGVRGACIRLARVGWRDFLFDRHGLDITAADLGAELARELDEIDRTAPGFEDFAEEGTRGIEPGKPCLSLLFHALASPQVADLEEYPTQAEIEAIENYVYGARPPSVEDLRARAGGAALAVVVYAAEYRPAVGTPHLRHADMCFSRTGVARVGTAEPEYVRAARGYLPFVNGDGRRIRVLPCRYAAYVAALVAADMAPDDGERKFWIPMHKLFGGDECLRGYDITLRLTANHVNDKIRRTHLFFLAHGHDGGWAEPHLSKQPFLIKDGLADFSAREEDPAGLLVPVVRDRLVEPATYRRRPLTYEVPDTTDQPAPWGVYPSAGGSSLNLRAKPDGGRAAPEYVHARHKVEKGKDMDLNDRRDMAEIIRKGGYRARHYVDWTADGWIGAECSELALEVPRRLPAYSLVATPDFFPRVKQSDLMRWTDESAPPTLVETIWPESPGRPEALSDQRIAANLELEGAGFERDDDTMTAIVAAFGTAGAHTQVNPEQSERVSTLSDGASGIFAPGWDVAFDRSSEEASDDDEVRPGVNFLASYGLGSPYPEDMKLCAALSSFWPAVAPDITRSFEPSRRYPTATPLTDELIGVGGRRGWDGVRGPKRRAKSVEYPSLPYVDYVQATLDNRFDISQIGTTGIQQYVARTLTMARAYEVLGVTATGDKVQWVVLSFVEADAKDPDLLEACKQTKTQMSPPHTYRFELARHKGGRPAQRFDRRVVDIEDAVLVFADPSLALRRDPDGSWTKDVLPR